MPSRSLIRAAAIVTAALLTLGGAATSAAASTTPATAAVGATAPSADDIGSCVIPAGLLTGDADQSGLLDEGLGDDAAGGVLSTLLGFAGSIASNFAGDELTNGAGWLLSLLSGNAIGGGSATAEQIQQLASNQQGDFTELQGSISTLESDLATDTAELKNAIDGSTYSDLIGDMQTTIGTMQGIVQTVCEQSYASPPDPGILQNLLVSLEGDGQPDSLLDDLSLGLSGSGGDTGLIGAYSAVLLDEQSGTDPVGSGANPALMSSEYFTQMQTFVTYFVTLSTQYLNAVTEVYHWGSATPSSGVVQALDGLDAQWQEDVNSWYDAAVHNVMVMPDSAVIDTRTTPPTAWLTSASLGHGATSPQYCAAASGSCVFTVWQNDDATLASSTVVPAVSDLSVRVASQYPGWSIPSISSLDTLLTASAGSAAPADGVATWAAANDFVALQARSFTPPTGELSTIPPIVVDDAVAQVMTYNSTSAGVAKTAPAGNSYAGQLVLTSPVAASGTPITANPLVAASSAAEVDAPDAAVEQTARTGAAVAAQAEVGGTLGTLGEATVFSTASDCSANRYVQPAGANAVEVVITGAPGGSSDEGLLSGGSGGSIVATIPLGANAGFFVQVGGAGESASSYNVIPAGGIGGGGQGGKGYYEQNQGLYYADGGGGGGASGLSIDSGCADWVALAGGGGGAGGDQDYLEGAGGDGGDACVTTGCSGQTPTKSNGSDATDDGAGEAGGLLSAGSAGHHHGHYASGGTAGSLYQGGAGGSGVVGNVFTENGGSGGGGGGGFGSGGGGGGSDNAYQGAGGGGGGSYLALGLTTAAFSVASPGTGASVSITPVVAPEYAITQTDGHAWSAVDGAVFSDAPTGSGSTGDWALLGLPPVEFLDDTEYLIVDTGSGQCVAAEGPTLQLQPCQEASSTRPSLQDWDFDTVTAGADVAITSASGFSAVGGAAFPSDITLADFEPVDWATWDLTPSSASIWAPPGASATLGDVGEPTPPGPDPTPEPSPAPSPSAAPTAPGTGPAGASGPGGELAATGANGGLLVPLVAAGLLAVALGAGLALRPGRPRRAR